MDYDNDVDLEAIADGDETPQEYYQRTATPSEPITWPIVVIFIVVVAGLLWVLA